MANQVVQYSHHLYMGYPLRVYNEMGVNVGVGKLERQENGSLAIGEVDIRESEQQR